MCERRVDLLVYSLPLHRHSYIGFILAFASSIHNKQTNKSLRHMYYIRRAAFLTQLKSKVGLALAKAAALRVNLNLDGAPIASKSHTHPSHSQTSRFVNLVFIFRCSSSTTNPVCARRINFLVCSLSLHRHSYIGCHSFRFIDS